MIASERVLAAVSKLAGVSETELRGGAAPDAAFRDLAADSLDLVELVMELEGEFDKDTLRYAFLYIEDRGRPDGKTSRRSSFSAADPLWDRELDA